MTIPDAAIDAAAEALRDTRTHYSSRLHSHTISRIAIEAAMPAIREAIAQEIEAAHDAEEQRLRESEAGRDPYSIPMLGNWLGGIKWGARIARGGAA